MVSAPCLHGRREITRTKTNFLPITMSQVGNKNPVIKHEHPMRVLIIPKQFSFSEYLLLSQKWSSLSRDFSTRNLHETNDVWKNIVSVTCLIILFAEWWYGEALCKIAPYLQGVAVSSSVNTLAAVAVERYVCLQGAVSRRAAAYPRLVCRNKVGCWNLQPATRITTHEFRVCCGVGSLSQVCSGWTMNFLSLCWI